MAIAVVAASVVWGLLLSSSIGQAAREHANGPAIMLLVVGWGPALATVLFLLNRVQGQMAARLSLREELGTPEGLGYDHAENGSAIAVNPATRKVAVRIGAKSRTYDYADIREWEGHTETPGRAIGVGVQGALLAGSANIGESMRARAKSGFFLRVRDVEQPEWRISMSDRREQLRWVEILRQEINEGGVAARA